MRFAVFDKKHVAHTLPAASTARPRGSWPSAPRLITFNRLPLLSRRETLLPKLLSDQTWLSIGVTQTERSPDGPPLVFGNPGAITPVGRIFVIVFCRNWFTHTLPARSRARPWLPGTVMHIDVPELR